MKKQKIRVLDFFAGTGAFDSALDRLGIEYELVDAVEIDKYAMSSFNAVHGGEVINHSYTNSDQRKELKDYIENNTGVMPTLTTRPDIMGYVEGQPNVRIRKLTPKETWRLQAYHDDEFERAEKVCSHAQLYKQAGNGCTVSVLAALMSQLDILGVKPWNEMSLKEREKLVYV